ncbi:DNA ligase [Pseudoalteromonas sp. SG43-7]|uniref:DNA ligase n=1 Tax=unclassified Pseudoalteromonas TaxID=194690 RepID=UPI0016028907|nr:MULTISPECIES: DNA ligase [unclassified Pseudoalteromonas]MBB1409097.1 DNA ligase [Pseudoalteromonas sp. SG44-17]MBB1422409.1 DNA ligase [Pseudoalteromonas sp. SG43-7]
MLKGLTVLWLLISTFTCLATDTQITADAQLAKVYQQDQALAIENYLVSEKFDGVRAIWTGTQLITRNGNAIHAPGWFIADLPNLRLDGELWTKRGDFADLSGIVRTLQPLDSDWQKVTYQIFDMPDQHNPFAVRYENYLRLVKTLNKPHIQAVQQYQFTTEQALSAYFDKVTQQGGEGVMLHLASAMHKSGRSDALLKLKPYFDSEAVVIAHLPGKGKFTGMLGALKVVTPQGKEFSIGTGFSNAQRQNPPAIGATVTYRYHGFTKNGLPRFASFLRQRDPD